MAVQKKKNETRDEVLSRVSKEYNITPKASKASTKGTIIASSVGSERTYKKAGSKSQQQENNKNIAQSVAQKYNATRKNTGKWYSGNTPTARETMARMFERANGDTGFFNKMNEMFAAEQQDRGSVIYNPYAQATNYKAIDGLRQLGVEVPETISDEWIDSMWRQYGQYSRETTTGYGPGAPTKASTVQNDIAYWVNTLMEDKEATNLAETQMQDMYTEVEYLAKQGYNDDEILKRVKANKDYNALWKMDEARLAGDAVRLNRKVNYSGDDTIYGMIWAARNDGGTGDYFVDSVKALMGHGNQYKYDSASAAALDPSNYEGYSPYVRGTMHEMNMKYGVDSFDQTWLEANRSMLSDPEKAEDWRNIKEAVERSESAEKELAALDQWLEKQIASGRKDAQSLADELTAMISDGDEIRYTDADGKMETIKLSTLAKMEDYRADGTYVNLGYGVDFNLPQYIAKATAMYDEHATAAAETEAETGGGVFKAIGDGIASAWRWLTGDKGAMEDVIDAQKTGDVTEFASIEDAARKYAKDMFGVDITGELPAHVEAALKDAIAKANKADLPGASKEDIDAANTAAGVLQDMFSEVIANPDMRAQETAEAPAEEPAEANYKAQQAYTTVFEKQPEEPREGMVEMVAEPTAYTAGAAEPAEASPAAASYESMLQGGEWDNDAFVWALNESSSPKAIKAELGQAIIDHRAKGTELTGLAKSWWNKFGGLVDDIGGPTDYNQLVRYEMGLDEYDSRKAYGTQVFDLLQANSEAYDSSAIDAASWANNLITISGMAEAINRAAGGERATDEVADRFLAQSGLQATVDGMLNTIEGSMERQAADKAEENRQRTTASVGVIQRMNSGTMTEDDLLAYVDIMSTDISKTAAQDKTYAAANAYIIDALSFDSIAESGMRFTYGDKAVDASYGKEMVLNEGASIYSTGVTALAQDTLNTHMKYAAACGMTLEQFYTQFPDLARTPEQIVAEARSEYNGTWTEFGHTIDGLIAANDSIFNAGEGAGAPGDEKEDVLSFSDSLVLAFDKLRATNALNWDKTLYMMQYAWRDEEMEQGILLDQYGGRTALAAEWDKFDAEREEQLRKTYENDITAKQSGISYEDWRLENTDKQLDEVRAKRETATDILELGDPARLRAEQGIIEKTGNVANIDKLVAEYGSEFDKAVYDGATSLMQTGQFMFISTVLGGGYMASLAATLTSSGSDAYDRFIQTGDYDAALASSIGAWLVNAAIEKMSFERYMPESLGGSRTQKMQAVQSMLQREGMYSMLKDPKKLSKAATAVMEAIATAGVNSASEGLEETLQYIVDSFADNIAYGDNIWLTDEQVSGIDDTFVAGTAMGAVLDVGTNLVFGRPKFTDELGNAISKAEAQIRPEHDGVLLNEAIKFEATSMAYVNSTDALAQIESSSENAAKQQAEQELQAVEAELQETEAKLASVQAEHDTAIMALEDVNVEMQDSDAFTEDMGKRMTAAATEVDRTTAELRKVKDDLSSAQGRREAAQQKLDDATAKVQAMYDQVMDEAKQKYTQIVTDKYYAGDSDEQRAAGEAYQAACANLEEAKAALATVKADENAGAKERGRALLDVDKATEAVEAAKAEMDAAYAQSPEGKVEAATNKALEDAQKAADDAAAAAEADPMNSRKQLAAEHAQAQLDVIRAKQEMEEKRSGISFRLKSPDSSEREAAVGEWKAAQQKVTDAEEHAKAVETEFNETDTQKNLQTAIDNMKQYTNEQLLFESEEGHEDAVRAYAELQVAQAAAEVENAWNGMLKDGASGLSAYQDARNKYNSAIDNKNAMNYTKNGEVYDYGNESEGIYGENVRGTSGIAGDGSGSRTTVRGSDSVPLYGDRGIARRNDAGGSGSGQRVDGSVRYASTAGITDVTATPEEYIQALDAAKAAPPEDGHQVSPHKVEEVMRGDLRPFLTSDKLAGFAVEANGNITGVFRNPKSKLGPVMDDMMLSAIQEGGNRLDCYAGDLFNDGLNNKDRIGPLVNKYAKYGFKPVAVVKYNAEYAESDKVQDVIFFIHNGKSVMEIKADLEAGDYEQYTPDDLLALKTFGLDDPDAYDNAAKYRDGLIEQHNSDIQAWRNIGDGFGDHRTPGRTGETTTADRNPIEILSDLTRRIGVGYNPGGDMSTNGRRLPRAVQGFYSRHARAITTRGANAGDLEVGLHEFGHAVQQRLPNLHANTQLLNGLSQGVRNAYDQQELDGEAIAEFVVDYIFNRDEAVRQAGAQFVQDFEDMLANDRTLYDAIMDASHQTELWNNADTGSKIGAMTKDGNDPRRGQIGNWLSRTLRNVETAVADLTAPADLVSRDFRRRALYSMHASRRADVSLTRFLIDPQGRNIGQSLAERFYRAGVTEGDQAEVSRYALAKHALDRRAQNRDVFTEAEFPTAELEAYVADIEANHQNIVAGANALTSFWNDFMDAWWVGTGMIDAEDVATMRAMYPHYVPTFRVMGENFNQYGGGNARFQMRRAVVGGSSLEVIDPIASIVKMTQQMTSTVTQNQLMREFHEEWRRGGLGDIAEDVTQQYRVQRNDTTNMQAALDAIAATGMVDPALMGDAYAQMLNLQEHWYGTGQNYDANVVSGVDENGNRFFYKIKDRGLYNLLSGAANRSGDMGAILRTVRNIKNGFTKMTTGSNPLFALKNLQRDIQASVNTGTHSMTYADGIYHWARAFYEVLTGSETYRDWQAMGGGEHTRFNTELNGQEAGRVVRELSRDLMRGRENRRGNFQTRNTALENISNVLTWEELNNAIENASRYVEYRFGRHDLNTDEGRREAFMASQDVTTNFGTHGASGVIKVLNQVVPFMNATIQGLNKDANIIRDVFSTDANRRRQAAPKAAKTMMNTALTAMLQYALLKMFGSNEDDEDYALLSQEMRTGNLIIPIGKGAMEELGDVIGFDKPYIRIPIAQVPLAQGMYAKALDIVSDVANYSPMEVDMWRATKSILADSIPDGTVFQAISDAANNRTWYGGEIESEYMRNYSVTNRYDSDTPNAIIQLGQSLNVSPAKLDYLLNQYSGFAGKILMPLISAGRLDGEYSLRNAGENLVYNVLKNYTIDPVSSNDLSTSYSSAKDTISQIVADGKAGKPMGNLAYSADPEEAYDAAEYLSKEFAALDKEISALWSEYNAIKESDLSDGDKARQMRDLRRNYIVPLQQDAMALYEEYKMQYIDADSLALEIYGRLPGGLTRPTLD